ncbi:hypothetical protein K2173_001335 [Erythroxylum novogranatense]|uniref:Uncharacterized protein n=1 Tax=Erythroxylum novogranatense TaxID=1862640 RepID=A0AAV8T591_9ROSI|nr:hypothetical protein K2173_001335 [Erythroxylum novogranatense]
MDLFSFEEELTARRNEVLKVARELNILDFLSEQNASNAVSLADERDNLWDDSGKPNSFVSYHPHGGDCSVEDPKEDIYGQNNHSSALMISKLHKEVRTCGDKMESIEEELFHNLCPIDLNFGVTGMNFSSQELTHYNLLKMDLSKWGEKCNPYQACYSQAPSCNKQFLERDRSSVRAYTKFRKRYDANGNSATTSPSKLEDSEFVKSSLLLMWKLPA